MFGLLGPATAGVLFGMRTFRFIQASGQMLSVGFGEGTVNFPCMVRSERVGRR